MSGHILSGVGREIRQVSDDQFLTALRETPQHMAARLAFMSPSHHMVRDFVVRELPRERRPLPPQLIASSTGLKLRVVLDILAELERNLFFLFREDGENVTWAYPVTAARTRHDLTFSTGERISGA